MKTQAELAQEVTANLHKIDRHGDCTNKRKLRKLSTENLQALLGVYEKALDDLFTKRKENLVGVIVKSMALKVAISYIKGLIKRRNK